MLDGMSDSIQRSRIENLHSREVDRQSPTGLIFITGVTFDFNFFGNCFIFFLELLQVRPGPKGEPLLIAGAEFVWPGWPSCSAPNHQCLKALNGFPMVFTEQSKL